MRERSILAAGLAALVLTPSGAVLAQKARPTPILAWSPKPVPLTAWTAPNRPHWKLSEILAAHKGQAAWSQELVKDNDFTARYVSMPPGAKTETKFYADSRAVWIVQDGTIRFTIQGQPPIVATKGFLVQVPFRTPFSLETVGDKPSLRFEIVAPDAKPLYPIDEKPPEVPGMKYVKVQFTGQGEYDAVNRPYLDFNKDVVEAKGKGGAFTKDDKTFVNLIRGHGQPTPPPSDFGHFHVDYSEFWFVLEGKIGYQIEGQPYFEAEQGDVVFAPTGRWHRASFAGDGMDTRVAINPRPEGMHNYQPRDGK